MAMKDAKLGKKLSHVLKIPPEELGRLYLRALLDLDEKDSKIEALEKELRKYVPDAGNPPDYSGYSKTWTNIRKVTHIVKRNTKTLTSAEVLDELIKLEPSVQHDWEHPANVVSGLLSRAVKKGLITKIGAQLGSPQYKRK